MPFIIKYIVSLFFVCEIITKEPLPLPALCSPECWPWFSQQRRWKAEITFRFQNHLCKMNSLDLFSLVFKNFRRLFLFQDGGCRWNGCQNKGVCILQQNAYTCACELPWTGTFCETKICKCFQYEICVVEYLVILLKMILIH